MKQMMMGRLALIRRKRGTVAAQEMGDDEERETDCPLQIEKIKPAYASST